MLTFVTMAMDIGKHTRTELRAVFRLMFNSLRLHHREFRLICYTNIRTELGAAPGVTFEALEEGELDGMYANRWLNLSFNRRSLVSRHLEDRPIWIDLDTVVCRNLGAVDPFANFVVRYNLPVDCKLDYQGHRIAGRNYMLGHFWRLDRKLNEALDSIQRDGRAAPPPHDIQDYFSVLHAKDPALFVVINDVLPCVFNWEWSFGHPFPDRVARSIALRDGSLFTADGRPFAIMTFTFPSLLANLREDWSSVQDAAARSHLRALTAASPDADLSGLRHG